jgi:uncharacterized integral membrane protein
MPEKVWLFEIKKVLFDHFVKMNCIIIIIIIMIIIIIIINNNNNYYYYYYYVNNYASLCTVCLYAIAHIVICVHELNSERIFETKVNLIKNNRNDDE